MTRFNTGNPIGSNDPRDRDDNSKNLDVFMHTSEDDFDDRLGEKRKSLRSIENEVKGLLIAGGQIFETEAEGRAAAENGQYFFAESDDPDVSKTLYQRVSESESRWVADDPSAEFVKGAVAASTAALELASSPSLPDGEFYESQGAEKTLFSITDSAGNALAAWDEEGYQKIQTRGEFYSDENPVAYAITDAFGSPLIAVDSDAQPIVPFISEFHADDSPIVYAWAGSNGVIVFSLDEFGHGSGSGADLSSTPLTPAGLSAPDIFWNHGELARAFTETELSSASVASLTQPHTTQYAFYDQLMAENPDYITRQLVGQSTLGADIFAYTFDSISHFTSGISLFEVLPPIEIVITSGLHGNERTAQALTMMIVDGFVNRWRENPVFNRLRWQCRVRVVPCCNPDGIDAGTRRNSNNVDINRNFVTDWDSGADYAGPSAGSEVETQVLSTIPSLFPGATAYFDMHTHAGTGYIQWVLACNQRDANLIVEHARMSVGQQVYVAGGDPLPPLLGDVPPGGMVRQFVLGAGGRAGFIHETGDQVFSGNTVTQRRLSLYTSLDLINRVIEREQNKRMETTA
ncbi:DUF2817 domain-containing protein [Halomonas venusta]|uniref:M14 family zinc carboxypeptidase n=1 Tax=Vreelandella venusta TaxID=44935 RepID=UPI00295EEA70|nr:M14 family zinc carboxypeptidase [Halomonas venusta]MDW0360797.1 DUF2817 domain-containing protein [Halomonas venusta]